MAKNLRKGSKVFISVEDSLLRRKGKGKTLITGTVISKRGSLVRVRATGNLAKHLSRTPFVKRSWDLRRRG